VTTGLASLRLLPQGYCASSRANLGPERCAKCAWTSSPFHKTLLSSKTCGLLRHANLDIRITQCQLPSVVKDRSFRSTVSDRNVSAPGGVRIRFGAEPAENKKPGVERRASPSIPQAIQSGRLDGSARCSISFYPVFVTNLTSVSRQARSVSRLPRESGRYQHQRSIPTFARSSSPCKLFSHSFSVDFTATVEIASGGSGNLILLVLIRCD
jgi:hypothetical protein